MLFFHALQIWIWIWKDSIEYLIPGKNWNISYALWFLFVIEENFALISLAFVAPFESNMCLCFLRSNQWMKVFLLEERKKIQPLFSRASAPHLWLVMATFAFSKENTRKIYKVNGFECRRIESKTAAKRIEPKMLGVYICGPTRG